MVVGQGSSLTEVVAEAGLTVDPRQASDIGKKIRQLLTDENLRELMIEKGMARVQEFSWEKCARETLETITKT